MLISTLIQSNLDVSNTAHFDAFIQILIKQSRISDSEKKELAKFISTAAVKCQNGKTTVDELMKEMLYTIWIITQCTMLEFSLESDGSCGMRAVSEYLYIKQNGMLERICKAIGDEFITLKTYIDGYIDGYSAGAEKYAFELPDLDDLEDL